jgi:thiol-disulfide isomerase/thioredoxin
LSTTEARYRDILGWTYVRQGKYNEGLVELQEAVQGTSQPGVYFHLASALEKTGNSEEAILNYARAASYGGEIGGMAQEALEDLWQSAGKNPTEVDGFLNQQETWIRDNYTQKVLSRRQVYEAPDFDLETTKGGWVRLADQKGSPVLLFFWASWSESSWQMLKEIHKLSRDYGEDVLFLTVATDTEDDTIYDYVREKRIFLPVLFNDETDYDYKLKGVPTIFLIDAKGNVQFVHKGFRPEIIDMLIIEMEDLLKSAE